jgi:hypothetical protein
MDDRHLGYTKEMTLFSLIQCGGPRGPLKIERLPRRVLLGRGIAPTPVNQDDVSSTESSGGIELATLVSLPTWGKNDAIRRF